MKSFNSKILLFGEYAVLYRSDALSMPLPMFSGELDFDSTGNSEKQELNKKLADYFNFLKKNHKRFDYINLTEFEYDLKKGIYFNSSIPQNYGLGSSGALVAAIFERYQLVGKNLNKNLVNLRAMLQNLESWFHGKSSGIDPLVSFLNKTVVIRNNIPEIVEIGKADEDDFKFFLIDSKQESSTGFQIRSFQQILKNKMFYYLFLEKYIPYINSSITFFLEKNHINFDSIIFDIVEFQYRYLRILFPSSTRNLVKEGLEQRSYYLKLCGSGGGGFLLGFTQDIENTRKLLAEKNVNLIEI
ncbi:MAG: mevalonate kinase [Mariniphaga sp.]|nr:mevalonate kinase [Mariniphaga sp.]